MVDSNKKVPPELEKLVHRITAVQQLAKREVNSMSREIDRLISTNSQDVHRIEEMLDFLLNCGYLGEGEPQFRKLNAYYATLDPQGAEFYHQEYLELE